MRPLLIALVRLLVPPLGGAPYPLTPPSSPTPLAPCPLPTAPPPARPIPTHSSVPLLRPLLGPVVGPVLGPVLGVPLGTLIGPLLRRALGRAPARRAAMVALVTLVTGSPATLPLLNEAAADGPAGVLRAVRPTLVHALGVQEALGAPPTQVTAEEAAGPLAPPRAVLAGLGDVPRILGDLLGGVRTISESTSGISDATRGIAEIVSRVASTNWWEMAWRLFQVISVRLLQAAVLLLHRVVDALLDSSFNFVSQTPPAVSYRSLAVYELWDRVRLLANAGLALVALAGGLNVVLHRRIGTPYHGAAEFLPRLAVGAALANTSFLWTGLAIELNNVLCRAIGESPLPGWERIDPVVAASPPGQYLEDVVRLMLVGLYALVALLLLVQMLLRLALVDLLIVVAPLASLLLVLPQTGGWWQRWSTSFSSVVFAQFVQVVALKLGGNLLLDLASAAPDAEVVGRVLGVAMLLLTFQVPSLLHAHVGDGLGAIRQLAIRAAERYLFRRGR